MPQARYGSSLWSLVCSVAAVDLSNFIRVQVVGFGRYGSSPAFFLSDRPRVDFGDVLPVPVPLVSVLAIEQLLTPGRQATADASVSSAGFLELVWYPVKI